MVLLPVVIATLRGMWEHSVLRTDSYEQPFLFVSKDAFLIYCAVKLRKLEGKNYTN